MDAVDVSKIVNSKIGGVLERVMAELVPEVQPLIAEMPEVQAMATDEERRLASAVVSAKIVATMIVASVLAQLRAHGCPEEMLEQVVAEARAYEQTNAQAATS